MSSAFVSADTAPELIAGSKRSAPPATAQVRRYVFVSAVFAVVAIMSSVAFHTFEVASNWLLVLDGMLLLYLLALAWIHSRLATTDLATTVVRLCLAQWSLAVFLVLLEQWFIHITPLIVILPLMMATGAVDAQRYRLLVRLAMALIIATTITARFLPETPLYALTTSGHRSAIALSFTPAFAMFVSFVAWLNHGTMSATSEKLIASQEQTRLAESSAHTELKAKLARVQSAAQKGAEVINGWLQQNAEATVEQIAAMHAMIRHAAGELRDISHGLVPGDTDSQPRPRRVDVPALESDHDVGAEPGLLVAVQRSASFSILCLCMSGLMYIFILDEPALLSLTCFVALFHTVPSLAARFLVRRTPVVAICLVAFALWIPPIVFGYYFGFIKAFYVPAMLIPIVISLPYLSQRQVGSLSAVGCVAIAAMIAVARLNLATTAASSSSPDLINDLVVVTLLPFGTFIVLWLANRNHLALAARHRRLLRAQRETEHAHRQVLERIERDLHDGAQQRFVSASLRLAVSQETKKRDAEVDVTQHLTLAYEELSRAADALATLTMGPNQAMTPDQLDAELRVLADRHPAAVTVATRNLPDPMPAAVVETIWFCCTEATSNTLKHAGSQSAIAITLSATPNRGLVLVITDDGPGFNPPATGGTPGGVGLANLEERFFALGGRLVITSSPDRGTEVRGYIPPSAVPAAGVIDLRTATMTPS